MEQSITTFVDEYLPYLEDIRRRFLFVVAFFCAVAVGGFFVAPNLIHEVTRLLNFEGVSYAVFSPFRLLSASMDIGFFIAIMATVPLILCEIYEFLAPGFTKRERRITLFYIFLSIFLFVVGFTYGLAVMYYASYAIAGFNGILGLTNMWDIASFISQVLVSAAVLGILFQFPLILSLCMRIGVVSRRTLARGRRVAIAATVCVVALLPPTDGASLVVMSVPLIGLYELTLLLARERKRQVVPASLSMRPL